MILGAQVHRMHNLIRLCCTCNVYLVIKLMFSITCSLKLLFQLISVLSISKDGKYLAAGCSDGWIFCFGLNTNKCIDK